MTEWALAPTRVTALPARTFLLTPSHKHIAVGHNTGTQQEVYAYIGLSLPSDLRAMQTSTHTAIPTGVAGHPGAGLHTVRSIALNMPVGVCRIGAQGRVLTLARVPTLFAFMRVPALPPHKCIAHKCLTGITVMQDMGASTGIMLPRTQCTPQ